MTNSGSARCTSPTWRQQMHITYLTSAAICESRLSTPGSPHLVARRSSKTERSKQTPACARLQRCRWLIFVARDCQVFGVSPTFSEAVQATGNHPLASMAAESYSVTSQCTPLVSDPAILCECQCSPADAHVVVEETPIMLAAAAGCRGGGAPGGGNRGGGGKGNACVLYHEEGGIATLTLNRPKSKNAFSRAVFSRLVELLARAEQSESVLAVVLTGAGGYFTSGADVKELQTGPVLTEPMLQQPFGAFSTAVLRFPKLLVAAVNGPAVGVGVTLLPHCDVVYAYGGAGGGVVEGVGRRRRPTPHAPPSLPSSSFSSSRGGGERQRTGAGGGMGEGQDGAATFWTPFFRLAIVPEFCSSVTFPEILGWSLANEMLVTGRKLAVQEALLSGLVSTVIAAETEGSFLAQVKDHLRRSTLETYQAAESIETFKRLMWRERRPRLLRVLAEECAELDRRMQAGHPRIAVKHLAKASRL